MGTATTMAIAAEALGMALPGSAAVPAVESRRRDLAERTGVRAMELARAGTRPEDVMTPPAFDNAIRVLSATDGSTNKFMHLVAIAGRLGISLGLIGSPPSASELPRCSLRPSGPFSLEDVDDAAVSWPCWRCWSPCWTAAALWVTGASWPKSVPLCALRRRGPIPGCVASMILPSRKVDPSCCGFACSAGRDIQAVDDTARVVDPPRPWRRLRLPHRPRASRRFRPARSAGLRHRVAQRRIDGQMSTTALRG
jgi:hypothetical protein